MYEKCKTLSDNNNNIETGMIWGNQFDRTLMWLMECNAENSETGKSKEEVIDDSKSWGNYSNATFGEITQMRHLHIQIVVEVPQQKIQEVV